MWTSLLIMTFLKSTDTSQVEEKMLSIFKPKVALLYDSQNQFSNYLFINIDTTETTNAYTKIQEFENLFLLIGDYAKVGFAHFNIMTRDRVCPEYMVQEFG